jgi:hypothetical protein
VIGAIADYAKSKAVKITDFNTELNSYSARKIKFFLLFRCRHFQIFQVGFSNSSSITIVDAKARFQLNFDVEGGCTSLVLYYGIKAASRHFLSASGLILPQAD